MLVLIGRCRDNDVNKMDIDGDSCSAYTGSAGCGLYDDEDFKSNDTCCICGGGKIGLNLKTLIKLLTLAFLPSILDELINRNKCNYRNLLECRR